MKDIYDLFLFISVRAFLPSLKVLKTSQERDVTMRMVSIVKEKLVDSISLVKLLIFSRSF